jgi:hypothetical protein
MTKKEMQAHIIDIQRRLDNLDSWMSQVETTPGQKTPITQEPCPDPQPESPIISL